MTEQSKYIGCIDCHHYKDHKCGKFAYTDSTYGATYHMTIVTQRGPNGDCGPDAKGFDAKKQ